MKKSTKVTLFAAAVAGAARAGARLARLVRPQNEELNDLINQEPGYRPAPQAPEEEPAPQAPEAEDAQPAEEALQEEPDAAEEMQDELEEADELEDDDQDEPL